MVRRHSASEKCRWPVGLRKCIRPLLEGVARAMMECAALCSSLSRQSCEDFFTPQVSRAPGSLIGKSKTISYELRRNNKFST
jgi:hypothetical protein